MKKNDFYRENFRSNFCLWKRTSFEERISYMIFVYEKECFLKERISDLIFTYEKEWFLKKNFQIWFLYMKNMNFEENFRYDFYI